MKEFPLKIYWVTTVWTKWQIIIPLEARNDMSINIANTYEIAIVDDIAIWLETDKSFSDWYFEKEFKIIDSWKITIWTKYQFVIPADIRKTLNINSWDNLIILWAAKRWLWLIKNDNINYVFDYLNKTLNNTKWKK